MASINLPLRKIARSPCAALSSLPGEARRHPKGPGRLQKARRRAHCRILKRVTSQGASLIAARTAAMLNVLASPRRIPTSQRGAKSFTLAMMPFPVNGERSRQSLPSCHCEAATSRGSTTPVALSRAYVAASAYDAHRRMNSDGWNQVYIVSVCGQGAFSPRVGQSWT